MRSNGLKRKGMELLRDRVPKEKDIAWNDVEHMLDELEAACDERLEKRPAGEKPKGKNASEKDLGVCCTEDKNRFQILLDSILALAELESYNDICRYAAETIYNYFDRRVIVTIVDYDVGNNRWQMVTHKGLDKADRVARIIGHPVDELSGEIDSQYLALLKEGRLISVGLDIQGITNGKISAGQGNLIARILGLKDMHCILFRRMENVFGNFTIIQRKSSPPMDSLFVEAFISQVGLFADKIQSRNQLKAALKRAEESDKLKTAFLSNISHEVRTPMNGILGFVDLLKAPDITDDEAKEYLEIIEKSSRRMQMLIESLVEVSLLQTNQVTPSGQCFDLHQLLDKLEDGYNWRAQEESLKLIIEKDLKQDRFMINADNVLLEKTLKHLMDNALRYTGEGFVKVGYSLEGQNLHFYIYDTGPGIMKENRDSIFEYFWQFDVTGTHTPEGVGLGLPIARAYVRMMGGSLKVEPNDHGGSTFSFSIPFKSR